MKLEYIPETGSTNDLLKQKMQSETLENFYTLYTDFQSSGRGQTGNHWESEKGKNLMFSLLVYPDQLKIEHQFLISQLISIAIQRVLSVITDGIQIKWPNDIYWQDKKLGGILIENTWKGAFVASSIIGVGININQEHFQSDAPNPISLKQITGKEQDRLQLLEKIILEFKTLLFDNSPQIVRNEYTSNLYRNKGAFTFTADGISFMAEILRVEPDGRLILRRTDGTETGFYFKEVNFEIT